MVGTQRDMTPKSEHKQGDCNISSKMSHKMRCSKCGGDLLQQWLLVQQPRNNSSSSSCTRTVGSFVASHDFELVFMFWQLLVFWHHFGSACRRPLPPSAKELLCMC